MFGCLFHDFYLRTNSIVVMSIVKPDSLLLDSDGETSISLVALLNYAKSPVAYDSSVFPASRSTSQFSLKHFLCSQTALMSAKPIVTALGFLIGNLHKTTKKERTDLQYFQAVYDVSGLMNGSTRFIRLVSGI